MKNLKENKKGIVSKRGKSALKRSKRDIFDREYFRQFYGTEFFEELAKELKISDSEIRNKLEDSVLSAAVYYEQTKESIERAEPQHLEKKTIKVFSGSIKKSNTAFKELQKTGLCIHKLFQGMADATKQETYDSRAIAMLETFANKGTISPSVLESFFDLLYDASLIAAEKELKIKRNRSEALNDWLANIDYFWITYCNDVIPFTAGRYSVSDSEQKSEAVLIFKRIINVIDPVITLAQMTEAVKKRVPRAKEYLKII